MDTSEPTPSTLNASSSKRLSEALCASLCRAATCQLPTGDSRGGAMIRVAALAERCIDRIHPDHRMAVAWVADQARRMAEGA